MPITRTALAGFLLLTFGCAGTAPSSKGLYGEAPGPQQVKGSSEQVTVTRTVPYTADEVVDAAETALFRIGLNVEEKNTKLRRVTASGGYQMMCQGGPCQMAVTVAVYARQLNTTPSTQLTLLLDRHAFAGYGAAQNNANAVVAEIQKVLSTYK